MKKKSESLVFIIIINYKGYDDTEECLESIKKIKYSNYGIIVVDNAPNKSSVSLLKSKFPDIFYIGSPNNVGFSGGNNLGMQLAYKLGAKYILFLNNDTIVSNNLLTEMISFMENHKSVGMAGPLTLYYDNPSLVAFAGGSLNRNTGLITYFYKNIKLQQLKHNVVYCNFIEGAALFCRAQLIKKIGGFNELYFLTSEESELCIKVKESGHKMAVITSCYVWHKVSQSMTAASELASYFIFRNKLFFVKNNCIEFHLRDLLNIFRYYMVCLLSFTFKKKNYSAVIGMLNGIVDFFLGRDGVGRYKGNL